MDKDTINVFEKYIHPLDFIVVKKLAELDGADRYVKKCDTVKTIKTFLYAQLHEIGNLGRISDQVNRKIDVQEAVGLESIHKSTLSRKMCSLNPEILHTILCHLIQKLRLEYGISTANRLTGRIHLIDSSTLSMSLSGSPWASFRSTKGGVKLHTRLVLQDGEAYPEQLVLTPARRNDDSQMDRLIVTEPQALHVFDRGYLNFDRFEMFCKAGIRFVTRCKQNSLIKVIDEIPVDPASPITREAAVRIGRMDHPLRLIETVDSEGNKLSIICNDAKIGAEEIGNLYRARWQIELFFKWAKQHLVLKNLYGKSQNAVHNQIYLAMITYCLILLMKKRTGSESSLLDLRNRIADQWSISYDEFFKALLKKPRRSSKGRRRTDYEQVFRDTEKLVGGEGVNLDDDLYLERMI